MRKMLLIGCLVAAAIALGFYQEQLKISINYILENAPRISGFYGLNEDQKHQAIEAQRFIAPFDYYHSHETLRWLYNLNELQLLRLKWAVTFVSLLVFFLINASLLRLLEGNSRVLTRLALIYIVFTALAFAIYAVGKLMSMPDQTYAISRRITGALQSLVPVMIVWPFLRLSKQNNT
jgi:hypothetical protein